MLGLDDFVYPASLLAYIGLGPGQEFLPQFVALLSLMATALLAVLQWPLRILLSRLPRAARKDAPAKPPGAQKQSEPEA